MSLDLEDNEKVRAQVAQQLGWSSLGYSSSGLLIGRPPRQKVFRPVPSYAQDIKAAWQILDCLAKKGFLFKIEKRPLAGYVRTYFVELGDDTGIKASAYSANAPMAICLAFRSLAGKNAIGPCSCENAH